MTVVEELVLEPVAVEATEESVTMHSPFALMHPDAARKIVARAAALVLPSRRCSPLSNPRMGGSPMEDEASTDFAQITAAAFGVRVRIQWKTEPKPPQRADSLPRLNRRAAHLPARHRPTNRR